MIAPAAAAMTVELGREPKRGRRSSGVIEIDPGGGRRVRVGFDVDAAALLLVLDALEGR